MDSLVAKRIKKLLALSESPNKNEAESAAAKARALLKQYNMEMADLSEVGDQNIDQWVADVSGTMASWEGRLASSLSHAFFCQTLIRKTPAGSIVSVYGRKDNLETMKVMYDYLNEVVNRLTSENMKGYRKKAKDDYRNGIVDGIYLKLKEQMRQDSSNETSLVKTMDKEVKDYVDKMATGTVTHRQRTSAHYRTGMADGKNVSLNRQVKG